MSFCFDENRSPRASGLNTEILLEGLCRFSLIDCASPEEWESSLVGGSVESQAKLGKCIETGIFIAKVLVCAAEYYRLSAEQGNADGRLLFGACLENGGGIGKERVMVTQKRLAYNRCMRSRRR
jgi:hypothetical protein